MDSKRWQLVLGCLGAEELCRPWPAPARSVRFAADSNRFAAILALPPCNLMMLSMGLVQLTP